MSLLTYESKVSDLLMQNSELGFDDDDDESRLIDLLACAAGKTHLRSRDRESKIQNLVRILKKELDV